MKFSLEKEGKISQIIAIDIVPTKSDQMPFAAFTFSRNDYFILNVAHPVSLTDIASLGSTSILLAVQQSPSP